MTTIERSDFPWLKQIFSSHLPGMKLCIKLEVIYQSSKQSSEGIGHSDIDRTVANHCFSEEEVLPTFHPEFGRFMLEATPGRPWGINFRDLLKVESNMRWRYGIRGSYTLRFMTNGEKIAKERNRQRAYG